MPTTGYGIGGYGEGGYGVGAPEYDRGETYERDTIDYVSSAWYNYGITIDEHSNMYALMRALVSQSDRIDRDLGVIQKAHHLETAQGREVERMGRIVSVSRREDESDERLKERIRLAFYTARTSCSFDEFARFFIRLLRTDFSQVDFWNDFEEAPGTVFASTYPRIYDNSPFTREEVQEYMSDTVPAGHRVNLQEKGTFVLIDDDMVANDDLPDADRLLSSDGFEGGTLYSDIQV